MDPLPLNIEDFLFFRLLTGFIIGLIMGSFATMASYRLPRRKSMIAPRSSCPLCGHVLSSRDLIPVFSWLWSKGKCRHCAARISVRYPLIELASAILFAFVFALNGLNEKLFVIVPLLSIFMILAIIKMEKSL